MLKPRVIIMLTLDKGVLTRTKRFVPDYGYTLNFVDLSGADELFVIDVTPGRMGKRTHLAQAIREAINSVAGSPIAGIVLISDGQDNAPDDDPVAAAEFAAQRTKKKGGVQIFPIAVGDASPPRNLQVVELDAQEYVWQGDPFELQATVSATGLGEQSVQVELYETLMEREGGQPGKDSNNQTPFGH